MLIIRDRLWRTLSAVSLLVYNKWSVSGASEDQFEYPTVEARVGDTRAGRDGGWRAVQGPCRQGQTDTKPCPTSGVFFFVKFTLSRNSGPSRIIDSSQRYPIWLCVVPQSGCTPSTHFLLSSCFAACLQRDPTRPIQAWRPCLI